MPYIKKNDRVKIDSALKFFEPLNEGELNYTITMLCKKYIEDHGGESYKNYNALIGVLECAKLELYRRKISNYENFKIMENGDL
jgi:hypothetical protein